MKAPLRTTIVGVFEDRKKADAAVSELRSAGFREDQIGVVMRHAEGVVEATTDEEGSYAGTGAVAGILSGLGLGALAGLGVLSGVIPVIGPAIAAGTLGVILSNAAVGAGVAGLVGALVGAGIPEEEAQYYQSEFEAGRTIVTVNAESRGDEATAILRRHGAYDMTTRSAVASEISGSTHARGIASPDSGPFSAREGETIQVKEERLHAEKRPVEMGEVRVRKEVHTENKTIEVPVEREEVVIERTPVQGRATTEGITATSIREGEEIRIPVREEQVDVRKQTVVNEEVNVGKRVVHDTEKVSGQVRKEEVHVDQTGAVNVRTTDQNKPSK
ncbi:YsnF/AvaK domain-containing protein [Singulisphaera sp. Ch08]|uniref:YsnF/AvaK domain-containing protein n=1 Tax=Singulisphaera sp. Ch08 TaxID=3120278 RepID=A0AAU7C712_9BACT